MKIWPRTATEMHASYTAETKLEAIEIAKRTSKKNAARKFSVDVRRIREWCRQEAQLKSMRNKKAKRLSGGGRPLKMEDMEDELINWINDMRENRLRVSRKMIQRQALLLFEQRESQGESFTASEGWLFKFLRRNRLSLRRRTTTAQKTPDDVKKRVIDFLLFVYGLRNNCAYPEGAICAADEVAIWMDPVSDTTIEKIGSKSVPVISCGNSRSKVTVLLAAFGDGRKLSPFIVLKGKRLPCDLNNFHGAEICMSTTGWMTQTTTLQWIERIWGRFSFGRRLLVWDTFQCHKSLDVKRKLNNSMRTDIALIPGGCTGLLQAPDVLWNKPFKAAYKELYEEWMKSSGISDENRTTAGNIKAPTKLLVCTWVVSAWNAVSKEVICKSFKSCGLTTSLDGSEDDQIHAVKELDILNDLQEKRGTHQPIDIEDDVSSSEATIGDSTDSDYE